jgi:putative phosphoesterase
MVLGLISDTHNVLDSRVHDRFAGVDRILHAGDVCDPMIIQELGLIAPVTVVLGNNDPLVGWRETEVTEWGGRRILIEHIVRPEAPSAAFRQRLTRSGAGMVVFGHTHRPYQATIGDVLFLNPGSAGSPRFGLPRSLALLHLTPEGVRTEFLDLDGRPLPL